ncbi:MAG TPA: class I SAM-dependent methyltransferase [Verrucomicrobiae bacterium]|nr:class I SAM-dependent methyltransferase [Verrucomicrobiae bacterium]
MTSADQFAWDAYTLPNAYDEFPRGSAVVDVGCGKGRDLRQLARDGCEAIGLDVDERALGTCRRAGLCVVLGMAEYMPICDEVCDGLISNVAIPYTDESQAMREVGRVLKSGARGYMCYHGFGYFLRYIVSGPSIRMRLYGLGSILNTWQYRVTGRRFSGFWGHTLYQTRRRLLKYYRRDGLTLAGERTGKRFLGFSVFMYHRIEKA